MLRKYYKQYYYTYLIYCVCTTNTNFLNTNIFFLFCIKYFPQTEVSPFIAHEFVCRFIQFQSASLR